MRILIVDDDYVSRVKLKALLSDRGDCDAVPNGELALGMVDYALSESAPYDLITMDVDMPSMLGQEVVREIRELEWKWSQQTGQRVREARILMITVRDDPRSVVSSFRQGCEGYLVKPVSWEGLEDALAQLECARAM